jgi:uncharacterized membrane-anchored protein
MIEKQLILNDLKFTLDNSTNEKVQEILSQVIENILNGQYSPRIWD